MIAALLAVSSVRMNTVQCVPVKYNTFVVYNKDRGLSIGSYLQMGLIKHLRPKKKSNKGFHNHLVLN